MPGPADAWQSAAVPPGLRSVEQAGNAFLARSAGDRLGRWERLGDEYLRYPITGYGAAATKAVLDEGRMRAEDRNARLFVQP